MAFLFFISCKNNSEVKENSVQNNPEPHVTKVKNCVGEASFGDLSICLPKINGQTECFSHPKIKTRLSQFNDPDNTILGYYINDSIYKKIDEIEEVSYDDYYQVYAPNLAKNFTMTRSEMKQIMSMMTNGFLDKTMEEVNKTPSFLRNNISIEQPILIEKYTLNTNSSTMVILMKIANESEDKTTAVSMNAILIKDRIIFVTHYLDYHDENSLTTLKNNTSAFVEKFIEVNN